MKSNIKIQRNKPVKRNIAKIALTSQFLEQKIFLGRPIKRVFHDLDRDVVSVYLDMGDDDRFHVLEGCMVPEAHYNFQTGEITLPWATTDPTVSTNQKNLT